MPTSPHAPIRLFARIAGTLSRILAFISIVAIIFMMMMVVLDVTRRNLGMTSIPGAIDYAEVALVAVAFFALGETQRRHDHVSVDAVLVRLPVRLRGVVRVAGQVVAIAVTAVFAYGAWDLVVNAFETNEYRLGLVRVILWPARVGVFAGFLAWMLQLVTDLLEPEDPPASTEEALESAVKI